MNEISKTTADEINRLHNLARKTANDAVDYAKEVGTLLQQVKAELPHGEFGHWITENLVVSIRQAQRYIEAAEGKPILVTHLSSKSDMILHLTEQQLSMLPDHIRNGIHTDDFIKTAIDYYCPTWIPKAGHKHVCVTNNGTYWVVSDLNNPNAFHISRLYESEETDLLEEGESDGGFCDCSRWAELSVHVEFRLKQYGLTDPSKAKWKVFKSKGSVAPFGAPETAGKIKVKDKNGNDKWIQDAF